MKCFLFFVLGLVSAFSANSQEKELFSSKHYKHQFFAYWGWNRDWYTNADLHFRGNDYNFTLANAIGKDAPTSLGFDPYLSPGRITIPQTNFRIGYFFKDNWSISLGLDHMKYVMQQDQVLKMNGFIQNSNTPYDGVYNNINMPLASDFLKFEHTDGLNYINVEIRRFDTILNLRRFHLPNIDLNITEGVGIGALLPKTNTTLLGNERYDEFHLAGYGASAFVGFNITFFEYFFIQTELKTGYINMPDIRTTKFSSDRADENFLFLQSNILVGANFRLGKKD